LEFFGCDLRDYNQHYGEDELDRLHATGVEMDFSASEWKNHAKQMEAEFWYIKDLNLSIDIVVDKLLYADPTHCLGLKKAAIEFIVKNGPAILVSSSYEIVDESPSLRKEVMMSLAASNESRKRRIDELS
jgi:hypothetical protein